MEDHEDLLFYIAVCNCEFNWKISGTQYEAAYDKVNGLGHGAVQEGLIPEGDQYGCTEFCPCANCWLRWFEGEGMYLDSTETNSDAPGHGGEVYYDYFLRGGPGGVEQELLDVINRRGERLKKLLEESRKNKSK